MLLFQSGGLQVKHPERGWIDVGGDGEGDGDPEEGEGETLIVVNAGLQLEIWTGGKFPASLHRSGTIATSN